MTFEGGEETSARSPVGSLSLTRRASSSLEASGATIEGEIEHDPIIVDGLLVPEGPISEKTISGAIISIEIKVRESFTPLIRSHAD